MARHVVARSEDLPPGERIIVEVAGRSVGVFNVDGRLYAFLNSCPHQGAELCRGDIVSDVAAPRPGEWSMGPARRYLTCPWHGWEFDLETGRSWFDPVRTRVRSFPAAVESGCDVTAPPAAGDPEDARRPGPYRAEGLRVEAEGEYVVVELGR